MCAASMPARVSPSSGSPRAIDERAPEPRAWREHQHARRPVPAHALRLSDAAHVAVVADDQRHRAGPRGWASAPAYDVWIQPGCWPAE